MFLTSSSFPISALISFGRFTENLQDSGASLGQVKTRQISKHVHKQFKNYSTMEILGTINVQQIKRVSENHMC